MKTITILMLMLQAAISAGQHQDDDARMLNGYFAIAESLSKDNLPVAKSIAAGMAKFRPGSPLAPPAEAIAKSESIETARSYFQELTWAAKAIARSRPEAHAYVYFCPLAAGGRGAEWLQRSVSRAANPYLGSKRPRCGILKGH